VAGAIEGPDGEDLVVLTPGGGDGDEIEIETGVARCRLAGEVLWTRLNGGRPSRLLAVDTRRLALDGEPLIDRPTTHPARSAPAPEHLDWLELPSTHEGGSWAGLAGGTGEGGLPLPRGSREAAEHARGKPRRVGSRRQAGPRSGGPF
jgi:hypothetical protein